MGVVCGRLPPGLIYSRLSAGKSHRKVTVCTAAAVALLFCEEK